MISVERLRECDLYQEKQSRLDSLYARLIGQVHFYAVHPDGSNYEATLNRNDPALKSVRTRDEFEAYVAKMLSPEVSSY